jgi:uncharacterized phiE125 gp8 family phage protein
MWSTLTTDPRTPILLSSSGAEPVTVDEVQNWLRLDEPDPALAGLISAARDWFERACDRQFTVATYELRLRLFTFQIEIPYPPLVSVLSVQYLDVASVLQTVATTTYDVVTSRVPAVIQQAFGKVWPVTAVHPEAVRITYSAGAVSDLVKTGIKMLVAHWYENRGDGGSPVKDDVPPAVKAIAWTAGSQRF